MLSKFKIDTHIPIALIFAMCMQAGGFAWWAAKLEARSEDHDGRIQTLEIAREDRDDELRILYDRMATSDAVLAGRLARIEQYTETQKEEIRLIRQLLERILIPADR